MKPAAVTPIVLALALRSHRLRPASPCGEEQQFPSKCPKVLKLVEGALFKNMSTFETDEHLQ